MEWLTGRNTRLGNACTQLLYLHSHKSEHSEAFHRVGSCTGFGAQDTSGTVVLLDNSRAMLARRPKQSDGKRYYTKAMVVEHYELLREFIDSVDRLPGMLLLTVTNQDFLDDSADRRSRGYGIYQALRTRIMDDVRDRNLVNPAGSLVRLSQIETGNIEDEDLDLPW